jgi:hypothetical protein
MEFIVVALFAFIGIILVQVYLYYDRKKQRANYPILWQEFEACIKFKVYNGILLSGNKLVFNKHLSQEHLTIIFKTAAELELKFPEFIELRLNAYNKQLHYNRTFPEVGSSGGIKQTWSHVK